jgi:diguanylate cyclase (GGDEF)-like protein/PAS domain S-box-containing protein
MKKHKLDRFYPFLSLLFIFAIDFTLIVSTHMSWNRSMKTYLPLQKEIKSLKSDISQAHLWLEEAIGGDPYIDIERDVFSSLTNTKYHKYVDTAFVVLNNVKDRHYLDELIEIKKHLITFETIGHKRWTMVQKYGIGSDLDQEFDQIFKKIIFLIDNVSMGIDTQISEEIEDRNSYFAYIMVLFLFINLLMFMILYFSKKRQEEDEIALKNERKQAVVTLESIGDAVITTDTAGKVTFFNKVAKKLTELEDKDVLNKDINEVLNLSHSKTHEKKLTPIQDVIHKGVTKFISNGTKLTSVSGKEYIISDSAAAVKDDEGNILGTVLVFQDDTEHHELQELLEHKANYDSLTGLPNRELFIDRLNQGMKIANRNNSILAVLFIDLDYFKEINDSLGHHIGDLLLQELTDRFSQEIRETDTISRLGGDEFTMLINSIKDVGYIVDVINKIMDTTKEPFEIEGHTLYITMSVGVAIYPDNGMEHMTLLKNADAAMYKAKAEGRNTYRFYTKEMTDKAHKRIEMETLLHQAIVNKEFVVYYQPQIDAYHNKLIGMEALVRWNHPNRGLISPADFLPLADEIGLITEIDKIVMGISMKQLKTWYDMGLNPGTLAINMSIKLLGDSGFIETLLKFLSEYAVKPEWIELEVTEGQIMNNPEASILCLQAISDCGIELAVDDFGTGYSSLSYLKSLPIDKLKIDKSFVDNLPESREDVAIAKTIIALAKSLELNVIAEGVETEEQKDFLLENGCNNIQGYYYSKPLSAVDMQNKLLNR